MKFNLVRFPGTKAVKFKQQLKITQKAEYTAAHTLDLELAKKIVLSNATP